MLYAGVGDASNTPTRRTRLSLNGKILRMTPTGGVPRRATRSPTRSSTATGHRNVQGLAWDGAGRMWATEFGQNTWDEINLIVAGGNYGWPIVEGMGADTRFRNPLVTWTTAEASPSGAAIVGNSLFAPRCGAPGCGGFRCSARRARRAAAISRGLRAAADRHAEPRATVRCG